ncbi:hypothetical protein FDE92_11770 [Clostridium botulinum]|nr:hypothetical protein DBN47_03645 [Clostridium botulinum]KOR53936.1 hypothetical protein ADT23_03210 [Clostridium botulinum]NFH53824.1 hypothetical protein [Clostridium botulinum]NFN89857.1 hypothetical protein [Clostridium botulinum]NFR95417.1 hypothetical protein [Clostridium botulinum]
MFGGAVIDEKKLEFTIFYIIFYSMTTCSNTLIALCESDSHQIKDLDSLLFFKVGVKLPLKPRTLFIRRDTRKGIKK